MKHVRVLSMLQLLLSLLVLKSQAGRPVDDGVEEINYHKPDEYLIAVYNRYKDQRNLTLICGSNQQGKEEDASLSSKLTHNSAVDIGLAWIIYEFNHKTVYRCYVSSIFRHSFGECTFTAFDGRNKYPKSLEQAASKRGKLLWRLVEEGVQLKNVGTGRYEFDQECIPSNKK